MSAVFPKEFCPLFARSRKILIVIMEEIAMLNISKYFIFKVHLKLNISFKKKKRVSEKTIKSKKALSLNPAIFFQDLDNV